MDRLISLLAALVGLIALGGALLVHNSADVAQERMATEIAELKASLAILSQPSAVLSPRPDDAPDRPADEGTADALLALQSRISSLEQLAKSQAAALDDARTALANFPPASPLPATESTMAAIEQLPAQSAAPAALSADGPTKDCIPLGTRFMAAAGDDFPICKTKAVVKIAAVSEGEAIIDGPGSVVIGGSAALSVPGCTIAVLSADISGYAEMRVTCI